MLFFYTLSFIISLFTSSFISICTDGTWFIIYSVVFGWWMSMAVVIEIQDHDDFIKDLEN